MNMNYRVCGPKLKRDPCWQSNSYTREDFFIGSFKPTSGGSFPFLRRRSFSYQNYGNSEYPHYITQFPMHTARWWMGKIGWLSKADLLYWGLVLGSPQKHLSNGNYLNLQQSGFVIKFSRGRPAIWKYSNFCNTRIAYHFTWKMFRSSKLLLENMKVLRQTWWISKNFLG